MLSELFRYTEENPDQAAENGTAKTLAYLEACSKLFKNGFLSHNRVTDTKSKVLESINEGFKFFMPWFDQILLKGTIIQ